MAPGSGEVAVPVVTGDGRLEERIDGVVIGFADPAERDEIERLAVADILVAGMLERARAGFGGLDDTARSESLPDDMWARISDGLDAAPDTLPDDRVVPFASTSVSKGLLWTTISSLAASVVLAVALGWMLLSQRDPVVVAVLINGAGEPVAVVEGAPDNTTWVTLLGPTSVPEGRIMQVWTKPDAEGSPVSLGVLNRPQSARLEVGNLPAPSTNQLYEITFEQAGGSPTGLPTGPVHGKGFTQQPL